MADETTTKTAPLLRWQIGDVTVSRVPETEMRVPVQSMFPDATPEALLRHPWLVPNFATQDGLIHISFHALAVEAPGLRLIVDTCFGEGKTLPDFALALERQVDFLAALAGIGFTRDNVDAVLCTHLHLDHVGWNTMRENDRWVPTFRKARYLLARTEYAYWNKPGEQQDFHGAAPVMRESIAPVVEAGQAEFIETDHRLSPELRLIPTPGHSPGHVSLLIESRGQSAVITGDMIHHPCQIPNPAWHIQFDYDVQQTVATRERMLSSWEASGILVIGTHFAAPTAGRIRRENGSRRLTA